MNLFKSYHGKVEGNVLPYDRFVLYSDIGGFDVSRIADDEKERWIGCAEEYLCEEYPLTLASDYIRFHREGDRAIFEAVYFKRRHMVFAFAVAEAIEGKGRFLDRIMDGIWLICDECDWVIPAHIYPSGNPLTLWWQEHPYMDLFAAETGATLALVDYLVGDKLDGITPIIRERLRFCVHERVIRVYLEQNSPWWMGFKDGRKLNNWTPWITSNALVCAALTAEDTSVRECVISRALIILDRFADGYSERGGCDEGPAYWAQAGAALLDCLETLYDMTGGQIDVFDNIAVKNIGEYIADFHIDGDMFVNFADAHPTCVFDFRVAARFGRRVGSDRLTAFGAMKHRSADLNGQNPSACHNHYRALKNSFEKITKDAVYIPSESVMYDDLGVMIQRDHNLLLAIKGGNNGESHNHNDIGNFIIYSDGKPVIIDAGVGKYTRKTFSAERYSIWAMRSEYHNTAVINGYGQLQGKAYCAKDYIYDEAARSLSFDIAEAYPSEADVVSYVRKASFGADRVTVNDTVKLKSEGEVGLVLMTLIKPQFCDGSINLGDISVIYSDNLTAELDDDFDMCCEDDTIRKFWGGADMYRVVLTSKKLTEGELCIEIKKIDLP